MADRTSRGNYVVTGSDYSQISGAFRKAAILGQPTLGTEIFGITRFVHLAAMVTGVIERCMVFPLNLNARKDLKIPERVSSHGLPVFSDPKGGVQINLHWRVILSEGCLRAECEYDGQGSKQQCAHPDQCNNRQFGSHLHCLYLSPIDELSCKAHKNERFHLILPMERSSMVETVQDQDPRCESSTPCRLCGCQTIKGAGNKPLT